MTGHFRHIESSVTKRSTQRASHTSFLSVYLSTMRYLSIYLSIYLSVSQSVHYCAYTSILGHGNVCVRHGRIVRTMWGNHDWH
eukprot:COSAG01_NODE_59654_length_299_cov_0.770000_1_plen_82_part_01